MSDIVSPSTATFAATGILFHASLAELNDMIERTIAEEDARHPERRLGKVVRTPDGRLQQNRLGKYYELQDFIADASNSGAVFVGMDLRSDEKIAIKLESRYSGTTMLLMESKVLQILNLRQNYSNGIPKRLFFGFEGGFNCMGTTLLGPSLADLLDECGGRFSLRTVLRLGSQILNRLEYVHNMHFIHRSIKPHNICMGLESTEQRGTAFLIDYGRAKKYRDHQTLRHCAYREGARCTQRHIFSSLHTLMGIEQSRRDDIWSLLWTLAFCLRGNLPWSGNIFKVIRCGSRKQTYNEASQQYTQSIMMKTKYTEIFAGFPCEFVRFAEYLQGMRFEETPDYTYLRGLLRTMALRDSDLEEGHGDALLDLNDENATDFDWCRL